MQCDLKKDLNNGDLSKSYYLCMVAYINIEE